MQPPELPIEPFGASKKARFVSTKPCALITSGPKRMLPRSFRTRTVPIGLMIVPSRITFDAAIAPGWRLRIWITVAGKRCWMSNSIVARFGGNSSSETSFGGLFVGPGMFSTVTVIVAIGFAVFSTWM